MNDIWQSGPVTTLAAGTSFVVSFPASQIVAPYLAVAKESKEGGVREDLAKHGALHVFLFVVAWPSADARKHEGHALLLGEVEFLELLEFLLNLLSLVHSVTEDDRRRLDVGAGKRHSDHVGVQLHPVMVMG